MKNITSTVLLFLLGVGVLSQCGDKLEEKGFAVSPTADEDKDDPENSPDGISNDSLSFPTRPSTVLLTGDPHYRLTTIFKVNYNRDSTSFIGSHDFHYSYNDQEDIEGNAWHGHYLPGFVATYGYNLVNISHYDTEKQKAKKFFPKPVLIKTLYYPSFERDTLNNKPVNRNFFMISVYDEDTNKDGYINVRDLRRFYYFDIDGGNRRELVPSNYSVYKSEYDSANDFVYVFAKLDENKNGRVEEGEADHIFWVDLKDPGRTGRQY
jgi:hypothetical protein